MGEGEVVAYPSSFVGSRRAKLALLKVEQARRLQTSLKFAILWKHIEDKKLKSKAKSLALHFW